MNNYMFKWWIIAALIIPGFAKAQLLNTDNVVIHVDNGATLFVGGDVQTQNNAGFDLMGILDFNGNLNHQGTPGGFTGDGTVVLSGGNQSIGGAQPIDFPSLRSTGAGSKTLQRDISVGGSSSTGVLDLQQGTIVLSSKNLYIYNPAASAVTYSSGNILSDDIDFASNVYWFIGSAPGKHTVPFVNNAGWMIPMSLTPVSGNFDTVRFSTYATNPANLPLPVTPETVTHIRNTSGVNNSTNTVDRFWLARWNTAGANGQLAFEYDPTEAPANGNVSPRAQRWNMLNDGWDPPLIGQFNNTPFQVAVPNVGVPGTWTISANNNPLPITLLNFTARADQNSRVLLNWTTLHEVDNDFFTIERSRDGQTFEPIINTDGAGTSYTPLSYVEKDEKPLQGKSYYRLRQTDFNGMTTVTDPVAVYFDQSASTNVTVYPNPAVDYIVFQCTGVAAEEDALLELFSSSGERVLSVALSSLTSDNASVHLLPVSGFARGHYHYRVISESAVIGTGKIVLE